MIVKKEEEETPVFRFWVLRLYFFSTLIVASSFIAKKLIEVCMRLQLSCVWICIHHGN